MSLKFVEEARQEYKATIDLIRDKEYVSFDDKHELIVYSKALMTVIDHLDPPSASKQKEEEEKS